MPKQKQKQPPVRKLFGWEYDPKEVEAYVSSLTRPLAETSCYDIKDSGKGKTVLLHKLVEQVVGHYPVRRQTIGDCVSHGFAGAVDVLKCVEIAKLGQPEAWVAETASEVIYGFSRVEVGGGRLSGDGSYGAWGSKAVNRYGTLARQKYGSIDLTRYSGARARQWGARGNGVPDVLEPMSREHLVRSTSLVTTYEAARDAIANGYPIAVCSMQGFLPRRDSDGFARPSGTWAHCMMFCAVDDSHRRPGLLCVNSWGPNWISGPKRHSQPDGSFWVDADVADNMLRRNPDSYLVSQYEGYPRQDSKWLVI